MFIIQGLGPANYISGGVASGSTPGLTSQRLDSDASFAGYNDQEETGQQSELFSVLKTLARLSRESTNDRYFTQEGLLPFLMEIIALIPETNKEFPGKMIMMLLSILKNVSGNEELRKKSLEIKNCAILSALLEHLNERVQEQKKL